MVVINYVIIAQKQLEFVSDKLKSNQFLGFKTTSFSIFLLVLETFKIYGSTLHELFELFVWYNFNTIIFFIRLHPTFSLKVL